MAMALWWPLAAWLSPAAAWFLFFNAVVGAIALMSSCNEHQTPSVAARRRLCRSGSSMILDRLRSFSIFAVHPVAGDVATAAPIDGDAAADTQFYCYGTREAEAAVAAAPVTAPEQPDRISQAADAADGKTAASSAAPPTAPVAPAPAEDKNHAAPDAPAPEDEDDEKPEADATEEEEAERDASISLDEAYALVQRRRAQEPPVSTAAATAATVTAPTRKPAKKAAVEGVSQRRRRNKAEDDAVDGKAELNARAELFIRQFREELKLQRLNSILSHAHALRSPTAAAR